MKNLAKFAGAVAILLGSGLVTTANADVSTMNCGDFTKMTDVDRNKASGDLLKWIVDPANGVAAGALVGQYIPAADTTVSTKKKTTTNSTDPKTWKDADFSIEINAHCQAAAPDATVVSRLLTHTWAS